MTSSKDEEQHVEDSMVAGVAASGIEEDVRIPTSPVGTGDDQEKPPAAPDQQQQPPTASRVPSLQSQGTASSQSLGRYDTVDEDGEDSKWVTPDEKTPLLDERVSVWRTYSWAQSHCQLDHERRTIIDYDVDKLTTMRVFGVCTGTVFQNPILWIETLALAGLFWGVFGLIHLFRWKGFTEFVGKESALRAFIAMFTTLLGFLLSFYTSLNIKRWWDMRMQGVEQMWQGCCKLTFLVSQGVTTDSEVLSAIHRYACASLMLIFLRRDERGHSAHDHGMDMESPRHHNLEKLVEAQLLTKEEAQQLAYVNKRSRPEAMWMWLGNIVSQLNSMGFLAGPPHYCALLGAVDMGRSGASLIKAYLDTPIPMAYVHLLGMMVKIHNAIVAILMAVVSVMHIHHSDEIAFFRTMTRAFFMPFLYNAILLINNDLADPFSGDMSDFPMETYIRRMRWDAEGYVQMGNHLPKYLREGLKCTKQAKPGAAST